jgi:hypothetical protein
MTKEGNLGLCDGDREACALRCIIDTVDGREGRARLSEISRSESCDPADERPRAIWRDGFGLRRLVSENRSAGNCEHSDTANSCRRFSRQSPMICGS